MRSGTLWSFIVFTTLAELAHAEDGSWIRKRSNESTRSSAMAALTGSFGSNKHVPERRRPPFARSEGKSNLFPNLYDQAKYQAGESKDKRFPQPARFLAPGSVSVKPELERQKSMAVGKYEKAAVDAVKKILPLPRNKDEASRAIALAREQAQPAVIRLRRQSSMPGKADEFSKAQNQVTYQPSNDLFRQAAGVTMTHYEKNAGKTLQAADGHNTASETAKAQAEKDASAAAWQFDGPTMHWKVRHEAMLRAQQHFADAYDFKRKAQTPAQNAIDARVMVRKMEIAGIRPV